MVSEVTPELLFLDIRMPAMDGFDLIDALSTRHNATSLPQVIFTTACDRYAVRAFEVHAIDYLLKPFTQDRLRSAVQRVRERSVNFNLIAGGVDDVDVSGGRHATRIVFKSRGRILFLPVTDIRGVG